MGCQGVAPSHAAPVAAVGMPGGNSRILSPSSSDAMNGDEADQPAIEQLTKGDRTYAWFFDVPFYKASDLEEFFADIASDYNSLEEWFCRLDYFSFEHLIFLFWRCIKQQAVLIDCFEMGIVDIPEYMKFHDLLRIETKFDYRTTWVQFRELIFEPDIAHALAGTFLLFHCDRT